MSFAIDGFLINWEIIKFSMAQSKNPLENSWNRFLSNFIDLHLWHPNWPHHVCTSLYQVISLVLSPQSGATYQVTMVSVHGHSCLFACELADLISKIHWISKLQNQNMFQAILNNFDFDPRPPSLPTHQEWDNTRFGYHMFRQIFF